MANVPPIPPLLCSTPPPIDFEDDSGLPPTPHTLEDDEFGDFAIAGESNERTLNIDVPSLPATPTHQALPDTLDLPLPNDFEYNHNEQIETHLSYQNNINLIQSFNMPTEQNYLNKDTAVVPDQVVKDCINENVLPLKSSDEDEVTIKINSIVIESENNNETHTTNVQSISNDTAEKDNNCTTDEDRIVAANDIEINLNNYDDKECTITDMTSKSEQKISITKSLPYYKENTVIIEDILNDSSDDENLKAKANNFYVDENSVDFFAIHAVESCEKNVSENYTSHVKNTNEVQNSVIPSEETADVDDDFDDFTCFHKDHSVNIPETHDNAKVAPLTLVQDFTFEANFDQFSNKIANESENSSEPVIETILNVENIVTEEKPIKNVSRPEEEDFDSDDDFGDFTDSTLNTVPNSTLGITSLQMKEKQTVVHFNNISDRLKNVLEMMFPKIAEDESTYNDIKETKQAKIQLQPTDTAKALEYQWVNSHMRDSLIKSLGIDCRNILFGEKWSSSMPRFAANLSYDPLQPTKSQPSTSTSTSTNVYEEPQNPRLNLKSTEIPTVEFDWNSSGLVNPLEGSKEDTKTKENEGVQITEAGQFSENGEQQTAINANSVNVNVKPDSPTASPTITRTAATTTLPQTLSTDGISHSLDKSSFYINISNPILSDTTGLSAPKFECFEKNTFNISEKALHSDEEFNYQNVNSLGYPQLNGEEDEVVTTSTYAGPLKETHIYTPSKGEISTIRPTRSINIETTKHNPIDFDYEKAAAGIVIDEKVITKEYRDIEYNPNFTLGLTETSKTESVLGMEVISGKSIQPNFTNIDNEVKGEVFSILPKTSDNDDEFTDFQSVPPTGTLEITTNTGNNFGSKLKSSSSSRNSTPSVPEEMILSPTILLPQAISIDNSKPKIEWGDTVSNINPEELARIEELFPQPKFNKINEGTSPHKSSPIHSEKRKHNFISISATIAQKEQNVSNDDEEWTEFVSVPAAPINNSNLGYFGSSNNNLLDSTNASPRKITAANINNSNDDDWSDFISSAPKTNTSTLSSTHIRTATVPQFNSAAWQNANFYNNPLSFYHPKPTNTFHQTTQMAQQQHPSSIMKFQNNNYNNNSTSQYNLQNVQQQSHHHNQKQQQSQIHIMQDLSRTSPISSARNMLQNSSTSHSNTNQFQIGGAKVAPSISLIPDLGFIAPAVPTHTAFINALPKPTLNIKK